MWITAAGSRAPCDDPKAYTRQWTVTLHQQILTDTEIIDEVCLENEKFIRRTRGMP